MKNNKNGFTLIEILTTVVILGIIVLVATNIVLGQVKKSRERAFITEVESTIKSTNFDTLTKDRMDEFVFYSFPNSGLEALSKESGKGFMIKDENENVRISLWNDEIEKCAVKSFTDKSVSISSDINSEADCSAFLHDLEGNDEVSVKSLTGLKVNDKIKASCYTINSSGVISNYNVSECGSVLIVPNKINGVTVTNFSSDFTSNTNNEITDIYMIGLSGMTDLVSEFMKNNASLKNVIISNNTKLGADELVELGTGESAGSYETITKDGKTYKVIPHSIGTDFLYGCTNIEKFYFTKMNNKTLPYGILGSSTELRQLTLEDLPKLTSLGSFAAGSGDGIPVEKVRIQNLDSLTSITNGSFYKLTGDADVVISGNKSLTTINNGVLSDSKLKSLTITNNQNLTSMEAGTMCNSGDCYIDKLEIGNNPSLTTLQNGFLGGYELGETIFYNVPNLQNIRYSAFGNIKAETLDLSGLTITSIDTTAFSGSSIDRLILPTTITSINAPFINSIVKEKVVAGGSNECALINLFRTDNGNGTYTYLVDQNKLPKCQ